MLKKLRTSKAGTAVALAILTAGIITVPFVVHTGNNPISASADRAKMESAPKLSVEPAYTEAEAQDNLDLFVKTPRQSGARWG